MRRGLIFAILLVVIFLVFPVGVTEYFVPQGGGELALRSKWVPFGGFQLIFYVIAESSGKLYFADWHVARNLIRSLVVSSILAGLCYFLMNKYFLKKSKS